jgi:hypothetical protein
MVILDSVRVNAELSPAPAEAIMLELVHVRQVRFPLAAVGR